MLPVPLVLLVLQVRQDQQVLLEQQVLSDLQVLLDLPEPQVPLVTLGRQDRQEP